MGPGDQFAFCCLIFNESMEKRICQLLLNDFNYTSDFIVFQAQARLAF